MRSDNEWFTVTCHFNCSAGLFRRCFFAIMGHMSFQKKMCSDGYDTLDTCDRASFPQVHDVSASPDCGCSFKILKGSLISVVDSCAWSWPLIVKRRQSNSQRDFSRTIIKGKTLGSLLSTLCTLAIPENQKPFPSLENLSNFLFPLLPYLQNFPHLSTKKIRKACSRLVLGTFRPLLEDSGVTLSIFLAFRRQCKGLLCHFLRPFLAFNSLFCKKVGLLGFSLILIFFNMFLYLRILAFLFA